MFTNSLLFAAWDYFLFVSFGMTNKYFAKTFNED